MPMAVADPVTICNLALSHLGQTTGIEDFDADVTLAAQQCRLHYPFVVDELLRDFPWQFATKFGSLTPVSNQTIPVTPEWLYSYRVPVDCVAVRRLIPAVQPLLPNFGGFPTGATFPTGLTPVETQESRVKYRLARDDSGMLIYCDYPYLAATSTTPQLPMMEYIFQQDSTGFFPADFGMLASYLLAFRLAPGITKGDKFKLGPQAWQMYLFHRERAQGNAKNQEQPPELPNAEWINARG